MLRPWHGHGPWAGFLWGHGGAIVGEVGAFWSTRPPPHSDTRATHSAHFSEELATGTYLHSMPRVHRLVTDWDCSCSRLPPRDARVREFDTVMCEV